jgi:hypothetical protein
MVRTGLGTAMRRAGRVEMAARAAGIDRAAIALLVDVEAEAPAGGSPPTVPVRCTPSVIGTNTTRPLTRLPEAGASAAAALPTCGRAAPMPAPAVV